ncbi:MAG TPA: ATP-binding cassette domain-containing protein [Chloroflexota bacterium]|jgi:cell division transport system ATP-binding protein|nr:ATP-binding cassette domain-containing protein [Chloroflexota bacterium]
MIVTRKLGKVYPGEVQALTDVSLVIPQGDFVFLVGPNGAGKTTLFKLLIRESEPSNGCVLFQGRDVNDLSPTDLARHRRMVGAVFQDARLVPSKTVFENVALPLLADGSSESEAFRQTQDALLVSNLLPLRDRFPSELSGGQQQLVAIARAFVNHPRAILADEPTGNLSPAATIQIVRLLTYINRCGITVIVSTHNHEVVDALGRRVLVLDRGRLVADSANSQYPEFLRRPAA